MKNAACPWLCSDMIIMSILNIVTEISTFKKSVPGTGNLTIMVFYIAVELFIKIIQGEVKGES